MTINPFVRICKASQWEKESILHSILFPPPYFHLFASSKEATWKTAFSKKEKKVVKKKPKQKKNVWFFFLFKAWITLLLETKPLIQEENVGRFECLVSSRTKGLLPGKSLRNCFYKTRCHRSGFIVKANGARGNGDRQADRVGFNRVLWEGQATSVFSLGVKWVCMCLFVYICGCKNQCLTQFSLCQ